MILDDDTQIREGLEFGVDWAELGFDEVASAGDGITGLRLAETIMPDIILSDVRMPGLDGLEFLHNVKTFLPSSKIVLISGYDDFEYLQKAVKYGAAAYELKPVKMSRLIDLIKELQAKIAEVPPAPPACTRAYSVQICKAVDYIKTHYKEPISTMSMGELLQLTPNYFSVLFKQETGVSFNHFLNQVRLEKARDLLEHTGKLVYEIAEETGFNNYIYFSQVFKKAFGVSPNHYRSKS